MKSKRHPTHCGICFWASSTKATLTLGDNRRVDFSATMVFLDKQSRRGRNEFPAQSAAGLPGSFQRELRLRCETQRPDVAHRHSGRPPEVHAGVHQPSGQDRSLQISGPTRNCAGSLTLSSRWCNSESRPLPPASRSWLMSRTSAREFLLTGGHRFQVWRAPPEARHRATARATALESDGHGPDSSRRSHPRDPQRGLAIPDVFPRWRSVRSEGCRRPGCSVALWPERYNPHTQHPRAGGSNVTDPSTGLSYPALSKLTEGLYTVRSMLPITIPSRSRSRFPDDRELVPPHTLTALSLGPKARGYRRNTWARTVQIGIEHLGFWWCNLMHNAPMWPIHDRYERLTCGRHHTVPRDNTGGDAGERWVNRVC